MDDLGKQEIIKVHLEAIEHTLGTDQQSWTGGTKRYERVSNADLEKLKQLNALDENERQNNSPTIKELRRFATDFEKVTGVRVSFDGYLVSPQRPDARISVEKIRVHIPKDLVTIDMENKFAAVAKTADTFDRGEEDGSVVYESWWD